MTVFTRNGRYIVRNKHNKDALWLELDGGKCRIGLIQEELDDNGLNSLIEAASEIHELLTGRRPESMIIRRTPPRGLR